ncbi:hypothetical protein N7456_000414 [Penicillium angulare]|uniref:Uncharacterized protein n=1 Tax=Penicillium angulare TaxID=116970 RepID=A0A9W9GC48_9EURO|nr:hypothetical protein N7456_000414 [Penicillium angulare]
MSALSPSRSLVCDRCWNSFFNTEAFEKLCTLDHSQSDHEKIRVEAAATVLEIKNAVCNWCAYIRHFFRDSIMPEDKITTSLSPTAIESCIPAGNNIFYLSISCESPAGKWKAGWSLFIHACTPAEDPASAYVSARPLRADLNSDDARAQMKTWFAECKEHKRCSALSENTRLPPRVIEVNPPGRLQPRILESSNMHGVYATLAYS